MARYRQNAKSNRALTHVVSALFLFGAALPLQAVTLAEELYAEGDRRAARVEALRLLQQEPNHDDALRIVAATAPRKQRKMTGRARRTGWAQWPIRLYQTQIGPAIGQRCSMHPSCSAYCAEAIARYGWIGIPMTTDRLIRETDHVNHRLHPIAINGVERYYNPVDAHSFWFRRYRP